MAFGLGLKWGRARVVFEIEFGWSVSLVRGCVRKGREGVHLVRACVWLGLAFGAGLHLVGACVWFGLAFGSGFRLARPCIWLL